MSRSAQTDGAYSTDDEPVIYGCIKCLPQNRNFYTLLIVPTVVLKETCIISVLEQSFVLDFGKSPKRPGRMVVSNAAVRSDSSRDASSEPNETDELRPDLSFREQMTFSYLMPGK